MATSLPTPIAPQEAAFIRPIPVHLFWSTEGLQGPFKVQVARDEAFTNLVMEVDVPADTLSLDRFPVLEGVVFWRVGVKKGSATEFGVQSSFTLNASAPEGRLPHDTFDHVPFKRRPKATDAEHGRTELQLMAIALVISLIGVIVAFMAFPGLHGESPSIVEAREEKIQRLVQQEQEANQHLSTFSVVNEETGRFAIPIDSAIARLVANN